MDACLKYIDVVELDILIDTLGAIGIIVTSYLIILVIRWFLRDEENVNKCTRE
jgi:hypothetical protein